MEFSEYIPCSACGEDVTPDSDFCPHCGVLFRDADEERCELHPETKASGVCIICRRLVCRECDKTVNGRRFCRDHQGVVVQQDWALVFQSTDINESGLAKSFLESNGFKVLVQNFEPVGYVWDGGGDSAISRSNISKPAKVFVPIPEYLRAAEAFKEWNSGRIDSDQGS